MSSMPPPSGPPNMPPSGGPPQYPPQGQPQYPPQGQPQYPPQGQPQFPYQGQPQYPPQYQQMPPQGPRKSNTLMWILVSLGIVIFLVVASVSVASYVLYRTVKNTGFD